MSFEEVKTEIATMSQEQQDELAAYLVHLRYQRDPNLLRELTDKIDDNDAPPEVQSG